MLQHVEKEIRKAKAKRQNQLISSFWRIKGKKGSSLYIVIAMEKKNSTHQNYLHDHIIYFAHK